MKPEVVPTIDKEKCKAGEVCYLQVNVSSTDDHTEKHTDSQSQLFLYEVVPDDKYWAVSGKTKGESILYSVFMLACCLGMGVYKIYIHLYYTMRGH